MAITLSNAARSAGAKTYTDLLDAGSAAAKIRVYDGAKAANPDTAIGAQVLLAEFTTADPSFTTGATGVRTLAGVPLSATGTAGATSGGKTATWFRAVDSDGNAVFDGTVSDNAGSGDLKLNTTTITTGLTVNITAGSLTQPA